MKRCSATCRERLSSSWWLRLHLISAMPVALPGCPRTRTAYGRGGACVGLSPCNARWLTWRPLPGADPCPRVGRVADE